MNFITHLKQKINLNYEFDKLFFVPLNNFNEISILLAFISVFLNFICYFKKCLIKNSFDFILSNFLPYLTNWPS